VLNIDLEIFLQNVERSVQKFAKFFPAGLR